MEVDWEELEGLEDDDSDVEMFPNMMLRSMLEPFWPFLMEAAGEGTSGHKWRSFN